MLKIGVLKCLLEICSGLDVAIREFFHHASNADLLEYCISLNLQKKKLLIVERLVETGLEAKKEYRELISKALLYLFEQEYLTQNDLACGFCVSHHTGQSISLIGRVPIEILPGKRHIT